MRKAYLAAIMPLHGTVMVPRSFSSQMLHICHTRETLRLIYISHYHSSNGNY